MISQEFYLSKVYWYVKVYYAVDTYYADEILDYLYKLECSEDVFLNVKDLLKNYKKNSGFTYSNSDKKSSIVVIGLTDSPEEFQDTFDHEKGHLVMHISSALGIDPYSEDYQYLAGEVGKRMFKIAKKFLCDHCRQYIL